MCQGPKFRDLPAKTAGSGEIPSTHGRTRPKPDVEFYVQLTKRLSFRAHPTQPDTGLKFASEPKKETAWKTARERF
jgi:hypothetical protein